MYDKNWEADYRKKLVSLDDAAKLIKSGNNIMMSVSLSSPIDLMNAIAKELEANHAIRKACENQDALVKEVMDFAKTFAKKRPIFRETKKRLYKYIIGIMEKDDPEFIETLQLSV
jgi:acyl-CoA hydrolase